MGEGGLRGHDLWNPHKWQVRCVVHTPLRLTRRGGRAKLGEAAAKVNETATPREETMRFNLFSGGSGRLARFAALALGLAAITPAFAADYPNRPIRVIVPFGAGGPTDVFTRAMGEELRKVLGQPLVF